MVVAVVAVTQTQDPDACLARHQRAALEHRIGGLDQPGAGAYARDIARHLEEERRLLSPNPDDNPEAVCDEFQDLQRALTLKVIAQVWKHLQRDSVAGDGDVGSKVLRRLESTTRRSAKVWLCERPSQSTSTTTSRGRGRRVQAR